MNRREFIGFAGALFPLSQQVGAQPSSVRRVGFLASGVQPADGGLPAALRKELENLGYTDGTTVVYDGRWSGGQNERLPGLAAELVSRNVDLIVAFGSPAGEAAKRTTSTIPIVVFNAGDLVETRLVQSLGRPGGNVTGVNDPAAALSAKRLELLKEILPETTRVGVLRNPDNPAHLSIMTSAELATVPLGLTLRSFDVRGSDQLESNFAEMKSWPADAVVVLDDAVFISQRAAIAAQAKSKRLALICGIRELIEGCLLSYAANIGDMYFRSASYVDRILKGAKPGDLPVQQPVAFDLLINLKIAKAFGLTVPASLLARADEVIE